MTASPGQETSSLSSHGDRFVARATLHRQNGKSVQMIALGLVLMLLGFLFGIPILWTVGIVVAVIGAILLVLGSSGHQVGARRHYW